MINEARAQLQKVYSLMVLECRPGYEQVAFGEDTFAELLTFLAMVPTDKITELIYKLSDGGGRRCPDGRVGIGGARHQAALDLDGVGVERVQIGDRPRR